MISLPKSQLTRAVIKAIPRGNVSSSSLPAVSSMKPPVVEAPPKKLTSYSLSKDVPQGAISASLALAGSSQVRFSHTDMKVPDFTFYRRNQVKSPDKVSTTSDSQRKTTSYLVTGAGIVLTTYAAKEVVRGLVSFLNPARDVMAMAKIEIKLEDVPEGRNMTFKWRGKPLFVRHRTEEEIAVENGVDVSSLRHPEADSDRVQDPKFLVVIGVCTHLGCVPIANAGDFGGYYCPCHGSHYDGSGRIRKGPAPLNLEVPYYEMEDGLLVVGN